MRSSTSCASRCSCCSRLRRDLPPPRRRARGADAPRLRRCSSSASRSTRSARPSARSRRCATWRARARWSIRDGAPAAHPRPRRRARRPPRAGRGRPRPGRRRGPVVRPACAVDESLLTGESVAGRARRDWDAASRSDAARRRRPAVRLLGHAGRAGPGARARCARPARAPRSAGSARSLGASEPEETRLQRETRRLVRKLAVVGLALCVRRWSLAYGLTRGDWLDGAPRRAHARDGDPARTSSRSCSRVFLALGAWRLSRRQRAHAAHPRRRGARRRPPCSASTRPAR